MTSKQMDGIIEQALMVEDPWWQKLLSTLLPPRCVLCGQPSASICICLPCKQDLPRSTSQCIECALPLALATDRTCGQCIQKPPPFKHTFCPLNYEFPVDKLVQAFKFKRQLAEGRVLSHLMCEYVSQHYSQLPDLLIPVPLHRVRMLKRGFNQAFELANYAGCVLSVPLHITGLRRCRNTAAQSGLSRQQRHKNMRGAFYWGGNKIDGQHVALIDDVMTTGTTVTECTRVLIKAGARRVDIWVAARALPAQNN